MAKLMRLKKRSACSHCLGGVRESHTKCSCLLAYRELTPPDPKILNLVGGDFPGKLPNMRLVAVEQLCKMEYVALEVNIASFSLCLHW